MSPSPSLLMNGGLAPLGASWSYPDLAGAFEGAVDALTTDEVKALIDASVASWSSQMGRSIPRQAWPKVRDRAMNDTKGHKVALQSAPGFAAVARATQAMPLAIKGLLEVMEQAQIDAHRDFMDQLPLAAMPTFVTSRVIGYRAGRQMGQRWHRDGSIATVIHRPAHDERLLVAGTGAKPALQTHVASASTPSRTMITGAQVSDVLPTVSGLWHAVAPGWDESMRISVICMLWPAPRHWDLVEQLDLAG